MINWCKKWENQRKVLFGSFLSREQMAQVLSAHVTCAHLKKSFLTYQTIKDNLEIQVSVSVHIKFKYWHRLKFWYQPISNIDPVI